MDCHWRELTAGEIRLLDELVRRSSAPVARAEDLLACPMDDGGMGSIVLAPLPISVIPRRFGSQVAEVWFSDADGVAVSATLNTDEEGELFELDVWKVDFSPLIRIPEVFDPR